MNALNYASQFRPRVACGLFGISEDFLEKYQSLDAHFVKNKESTFFFEAIGHSMEPTIFPGDILIVDRSITTFDNRVCVLAYQGEIICKRVLRHNQRLILRSDNKTLKDFYVPDLDDVSVWGVVIARAGMVKWTLQWLHL